jgi:tRNA-2-methylthio-N6-dimethylallyladenosine synthase
MNVHDSERISGMLDAAGYAPVAEGETPDLVVLNTCAVRENADNKLYGNLGQLCSVKRATPGMQIAVGGCLAQKDRGTITQRAPWVDVVFGTHNLHRLPVLLERARHNAEAQVEIAEVLEVFPSSLPARRTSPATAWVSISVGCDNTCTFCIVPSLRGEERDRRPGDVLAEVEALVAEGALEVTLLGQNVNSYGRSFGDPGAFAKLLRSCGRIHGLERVRFTSPHPRDFTDDVIAAMAETPNVCPQLHMPLQSGSDAVLRRMRRSYRRERYLGIVERVRSAMPHAAITTDIIVGFPGETEADFVDTLDVVRAARFSGAFTFQYSPRPGTPAATMDAQVAPEVVAERYARLVDLQGEVSLAENRALVGQTVEVLVAEGEGRKDTATGRRSGRARDGRLVHLGGGPVATARSGRAAPAGVTATCLNVATGLNVGVAVDGSVEATAEVLAALRPGDVVETRVTHGAPHHLVADGALRSVRRTAAGDAWAAGRATPPASGRPSVSLGMPAIGSARPVTEGAATR